VLVSSVQGYRSVIICFRERQSFKEEELGSAALFSCTGVIVAKSPSVAD